MVFKIAVNCRYMLKEIVLRHGDNGIVDRLVVTVVIVHRLGNLWASNTS
jgi:hypothetical protein